MSGGGAGKGRTTTAKERSVFGAFMGYPASSHLTMLHVVCLVGNIPYDVSEETLKNIFSAVGPVVNFRLVTDRDSGKPKGYGFCEYADGATALSAMRNLNGTEVNGRNLRVDFADGGETQKSDRGDRTAGVSGEALIKSIESAVASQSRLALYDMLSAFQEFARASPDATKHLLGANPVLVHALIECFKKLNISMTSLPPVLKVHNIHSHVVFIPFAQRRDPRLAAKREGGAPMGTDTKRFKQEPMQQQQPPDSVVADMARGMTADKLSLLPPNERHMLIAFMEQNGIPYSS
ncbi:hypothetical protein DYB37_002896 [Aphanomyces astaci]|uniref:RRM domain-containing protein n=1 Tax=Aphanomyces astaci TaxID=112090 RepID=A0A3R6XIJ9_APHAT|nr:hypothetical protein DYB35_010463 [Aphanomyces astaci]RHZ08796.1 hypothetical protein DYB37_002896 [Aphanomyces astaci]